MQHAPPFFVIRNSIYNEREIPSRYPNNDSTKPPVVPDDTTNQEVVIDNEKKARSTVVQLVGDLSKGMKLDFDDLDNEVLIDEITDDLNQHRVAYLDQNNWRYLHTYAILIGKSDVLGSCPDSYVTTHEGDAAPCFTIVKEEVLDIIDCVVSLEQLFSWNVLFEARTRGDLSWRDIRAFLAAVRGEVPFLTKDGVLKAKEPIHLTFFQFVSFFKLVQYHLHILPRVKCRVVSTFASAVKVRLTSSHKCLVQMIVVPSDSTPPTSTDMQHQNSTFVSWKSINVEIGSTKDISIDSLTPNTNYSIFLRADRQTATSTDADVLESRVDFATDCQPNLIPEFDSMSAEDQRAELFACVHDKSIRKNAPLIPSDRESFVSTEECSEDWSVFIRWWILQYELRTAFLMRELMYASSDPAIRRQAELCGIPMKDRMNEDPIVREKWSDKFAVWYFGMETPEKTAAVARSCLLNVQQHDFEANACCIAAEHPRSYQQGFKSQVWRAPIYVEDEKHANDDELSSHCLPKNDTDAAANGHLFMEVRSMKIGGNTKVTTTRASPLIGSRFMYDELRSTPVNDHMGVLSTVPKNDQKYDSVVDSGIARAKIQSQRRKFLDNLTKKVQSARTKADSLVGKGKNLRGLDLFRSKIRLVILLMKLRPRQACSGSGFTLTCVSAILQDSIFDLFEFDEANFDFDALDKQQLAEEKPRRYDPMLFKALRQQNEARLMKRMLCAMRCWKNGQVASRNETQAKTARAQDAYNHSLLKQTFHAYRMFVVNLMKERKVNELGAKPEKNEPETELVVEKEAVGSNFGVHRTPSFEMMQLATEDELASKFRESCLVRFGLNSSLFAAHVCRRKLGSSITQEEYDSQFRRGIELSRSRNSIDCGRETIEIGQSMLKRLKYEKLKARKSSGMNVFDVPTDVVATSCPAESDREYTDYMSRGHVKDLVDMGRCLAMM